MFFSPSVQLSILFALSPLLKVMLYGPMPSPLTTPVLIAGGETVHFQVAVSGTAIVPEGATLEVTLPLALVQMGATYTARWVDHVQVNETDVQQPGYYPDPLPPLPSILGHMPRNSTQAPRHSTGALRRKV